VGRACNWLIFNEKSHKLLGVSKLRLLWLVTPGGFGFYDLMYCLLVVYVFIWSYLEFF